MDKARLKTDIARLFLYAAAVSVIFLASYQRIFDTYELALLDIRYKIRPIQKIDPRIAIIEISDDSIAKLGSWPFDRKYHAMLVNALKAAGAEAIIFDVFFSEDTASDREFAEAVKKAGNVYLPDVFRAPVEKRYGVPQSGQFDAKLLGILGRAAYRTGHINIIPDADGKFRRIPPYIKYKGTLYPHMSYLAALDLIGMPLDKVAVDNGRYLQCSGAFRIPLDEESNIIVNFPGRWTETFRHYSYVDIIQSYFSSLQGAQPVIDMSEFSGSVCFIGVTATASPDAHPSPHEALYPGVGVHASLVNSVINRKFISRPGRVMNMIILALLLTAAYFITIRAKKLYSILALVILLSVFSLFAIVIFIFKGVWIDMFYPIIALTVAYLGLTFKRYIQEMHKRELIENELSIAKNIQESFLPKDKPQIEGIEIEAKMAAARQVGGDLYDFVTLSDHKAGVMIGDVSGKGVPAALYMAKVVSEFKMFAKAKTPSLCLSGLNKKLADEAGTNLFVTVSYLVFDLDKMELQYSSGGHLPVIHLKKKSDEARLLESKEGMPLGLMECDFGDDTVKVEKGDTFILYTDGVTEATAKNNEMFGIDRLVKLAKKNKSKAPLDILNTIHAEVNKFEGKNRQHDDITAVVMRIV